MNVYQFFNCGAFVQIPMPDSHEKKYVCFENPFQSEVEDAAKNDSKPMFFLSDFFLTQFSLSYGKSQIMTQDEFESFIEKYPHNDTSPKWQFYEPDKEKYTLMYDDLFKCFTQNRTFKKAVPYSIQAVYQATKGKEINDSSVQMSTNDKAYLIKQLIKNARHEKGFAYGWWDSSKGMLGLSPERLFWSDKEAVSVDCVAGTLSEEQVFSNGERLDFKKIMDDNAKLYEEHTLVIKDIEDKFSKSFSAASLQIVSQELVRFKNYFHLKSVLKMNLPTEISYKELVYRLHPTAAIGTFPHNEGMDWLRRSNQNSPRFFYGSPIGADLGWCKFAVVALRGVQWGMDKGFQSPFIIAGGGVTLLSDFELEWNEIKLKLKSIKDIFSL